MTENLNFYIKEVPPLSLKSLKLLFKNLNEVPVPARYGRCPPLIDSQQMVRSWITTIEDEKAKKAPKLKKQTKKKTTEKPTRYVGPVPNPKA